VVGRIELLAGDTAAEGTDFTLPRTLEPLSEVREHAALILAELRQVIPAFLARVDQPDRGGRWIQYFSDTSRAFEQAVQPLLQGVAPESSGEVTLTEFDADGELKVVASALYAASALPDSQLTALARAMSVEPR